MKAHKVPATYYASWNIPGTKHSFYVFYKSEINKEGQSKSYRKVDKIAQEHAFFMEEDFYYLDIKKVPGLAYKLQGEIDDFLSERAYSIECQDFLDEEKSTNYPIVHIKDYCKFMYCREYMDSWMIKDSDGNIVAPEVFKEDFYTYLFNKVGTIIEENYFANELEPKWNIIKAEIEIPRNHGDILSLTNKTDLLEFFIIQYLRLDGVITDYIEPVLNQFRDVFSSIGFDNSELNGMKQDGLLAPEPYFYGILLDAARGNKTRIQNHMDLIEKNYVMDLLKAESGISFITSTAPCVVTKTTERFKTEMIFPVSPKYCIRFLEKSNAGNRDGKFFEVKKNEVKAINQKIISSTKNIVMSESKNISDRI